MEVILVKFYIFSILFNSPSDYTYLTQNQYYICKKKFILWVSFIELVKESQGNDIGESDLLFQYVIQILYQVDICNFS